MQAEGSLLRGAGPYRAHPAAANDRSPRPVEVIIVNIRARKFVGTILLLALVAVWSLLAMAFAQFILASANSAVAMLYYVVAGLGWVLPAMPLISWMSKPDVS
jgi:hypothetical protein